MTSRTVLYLREAVATWGRGGCLVEIDPGTAMEYLVVAHSVMGNESEAMAVAEVLEMAGHSVSAAKKIFFALLEFKYRGRPLTAMDATGISMVVPRQTLSGWSTSTLGARLWRYWEKSKEKNGPQSRQRYGHGA